MFRGSGFAGLRDTISQGVPFMYASTVQSAVVDPLLKPQAGAGADEASDLGHGLRRAVAVIGTSIGATVLSQAPHNCQIRLQADHSLSYGGAVAGLWRERGFKELVITNALLVTDCALVALVAYTRILVL